MGTTSLSDVLRDLGFHCVLNTTERVCTDHNTVERGTPFTADRNNGVSVVYDQEGRPWIRRGHLDGVDLGRVQVASGYALKLGAYVPHSNDGGHYIHSIRN